MYVLIFFIDVDFFLVDTTLVNLKSSLQRIKSFDELFGHNKNNNMYI